MLDRRTAWLFMALLVSHVHADYSAGWGPDLGEVVTALDATDQERRVRDLDSLVGPRGMVVFFNRSALW
ncbi:MAG: hypothetical protein AAF513_13655 [Pseudomonadota bacterium]